MISGQMTVGSGYDDRSGSGRTNQGKGSKKGKIGNVSVNIKFNASAVMASIAAARTKSQAAAIERSLRAKLQEAKRWNCDEQILRAMSKTIGKAGSKVKALGKEERMATYIKAARGANNLKEEARLAQELARRRRARRRREKADILDTEEACRKEYDRYSRAELRYASMPYDTGFDAVSEGIMLSAESVSTPADTGAGASIDIAL